MTLYAIGDVQGCLRPFDRLLKRIRFSESKDHLWLVGDLVNRGPDSAGVIRRVMELGDSATCVLGNHDLHLLAAAAGYFRESKQDTFYDVLDAPDADELIDWLRHRPLLHYDKASDRALVHAGIPPVWTVKQALKAAADVESRLQGSKWEKLFETMYGDWPEHWSKGLGKKDRRRFTINALTRMRFCFSNGDLDFYNNGPPAAAPKGLRPWYRIKNRAAKKTEIVFGHWAALGLHRENGIVAVDAGCVWGGCLAAEPLAPVGPTIQVKCRRA